MALMKALSRNTKTQNMVPFVMQDPRSECVNDFRFLQNFIVLEWRNGVSESLLTRRSRVRSRAEANFNSPIVVAQS